MIPPLVDTSWIVRYLIKEPLELAERSKVLFDGAGEYLVSPIALVEAAYVLRSFYRVERVDMVDSLLNLLQKPNLVLLSIDKEKARRALERCKPSGRISVADALMLAEAESRGVSTIFTFDRRFPTSETVEAREPGP